MGGHKPIKCSILLGHKCVFVCVFSGFFAILLSSLEVHYCTTVFLIATAQQILYSPSLRCPTKNRARITLLEARKLLCYATPNHRPIDQIPFLDRESHPFLGVFGFFRTGAVGHYNVARRNTNFVTHLSKLSHPSRFT